MLKNKSLLFHSFSATFSKYTHTYNHKMVQIFWNTKQKKWKKIIMVSKQICILCTEIILHKNIWIIYNIQICKIYCFTLYYFYLIFFLFLYFLSYFITIPLVLKLYSRKYFIFRISFVTAIFIYNWITLLSHIVAVGNAFVYIEWQRNVEFIKNITFFFLKKYVSVAFYWLNHITWFLHVWV